jgi:BirA family biotin operon repressor/biotin-[acetyl-CoA-carboxylase] ligase
MNHDSSALFRIGTPHLAFEELPSTNGHLKAWLRDRQQAPPGAGTVVSARVQTSGYGQHGRTWLTVPGLALTFSVWLPGPPLPHLTIRAALGVAEGLEPHLPAGLLGFKWVNDLVVAGRKLGGILAEGITGAGTDRSGTVLGIGLNLVAPAEVPHAAGLLDLIGGIHAPVGGTGMDEAHRAILLDDLFKGLTLWMSPGREPLEPYRERLCHLGQRVVLEHASESLEGMARDLDAQGNLVIELDDGTLKPCHAGTLRLADGRYA